MALKTSSPRHQGFPPLGSQSKGGATTPAIVKDLKHLFGIFLEKVLLDLTNQNPPNTPVSHDQSSPDPDMIRQLLECASAELSIAADPAQCCYTNNKQEELVQQADEIDLNRPICTTPDDFRSFEKWASASQFKTVVETYEPVIRPILVLKLLTWVQLGQRGM